MATFSFIFFFYYYLSVCTCWGNDRVWIIPNRLHRSCAVVIHDGLHLMDHHGYYIYIYILGNSLKGFKGSGLQKKLNWPDGVDSLGWW